ncbi:MAG: asparagine synthase-related protein [Bacteroidales bacterium]|nr:asparagine synthase-related protein [Bacteroidales bacterium]
MPGIVGLISKKHGKDLFTKMIDSINHNDYKIDQFSKKNIHLGRVHLGYVNTQPQPVFSKDNRYGLIMIGEIYSYGNVESSTVNSDSEFLLDLFIKDGISILTDINGQFSASIYDFSDEKLYIISDRYGTRPVYYYFDENGLMFAPEVKALLTANVGGSIDYSSISELFHFNHLFGNKTLFENIKEVPEASYITYQKGKLGVHKYWDFPEYPEAYEKTKFSKNEISGYLEEMQDVFGRAMKRQMSQNINKTLIPLSGGLDSRYVIGYASVLKVDPLVAFTMGPGNSGDQMYGKLVAKQLSAEHFEFEVQPEDIWNDARYFSFISDGMSMIYGPIQGFSSYRYFNNKQEVSITPQMWDVLFGSTLWRRKVKYLVGKETFDEKSSDIVTNIFNRANDDALSLIFNKSFFEKIRSSYTEVPRNYIAKYKRPLHSYFNMAINEHGRRGTLCGNLMSNMFMETRMPSYDNELMEFSYKLPIELKKNQYLFRKAFSNMFPELASIKREGTNLPISTSNFRLELKTMENKAIAYIKSTPARKIIANFEGWNRPEYVNYNEWFKKDLKPEMEEIVLSNETLSRGFYDESGLKELIRQHSLPNKDHSRLIWQIINLEYFFRNFID